MVDRLRLFFNHPLEDGDRPRLFAIVVAILAGAALILALLDDTGPAPERVKAPAPATDTPSPIVPSATPSAPSEEGDPTEQASRTDIARSKRAARRFLAGYLPFTYGRGTAERIRHAAPELRAELRPPRVPARERRPRVELLQTNGVSRERAQVTALVRDGRRRYTVRLDLANTASGWLVTEIRR
jgi:hypothetical protein